jgi:ribose 5-phosphate isomerase B
MSAIAIAADEAGAPLKERLAFYLRAHGYEIKDFGNGTDQDYPDVAAQVAEAVARGEHDRALLVCGTGLGMAITANKVPGVRAVTVHDAYSAEPARKSNNAQVLTMGARVIVPEAAEMVLEHLRGLHPPLLVSGRHRQERPALPLLLLPRHPTRRPWRLPRTPHLRRPAGTPGRTALRTHPASRRVAHRTPKRPRSRDRRPPGPGRPRAPAAGP